MPARLFVRTIKRNHRARFGESVALQDIDAGGGKQVGKVGIQGRAARDNVLYTPPKRSPPLSKYERIGNA